MLNRLFIKDKEKRKKIAHFGAGIAILVHAYENYDVGHHTYPFFAIAGVLVLLMAFFHSKLEKNFLGLMVLFL